MAGPGASLLLSCSYACKCSCSLSGAHVLSQRAAGATGLAGPSGSTCCPMHAWGVQRLGPGEAIQGLLSCVSPCADPADAGDHPSELNRAHIAAACTKPLLMCAICPLQARMGLGSLWQASRIPLLGRFLLGQKQMALGVYSQPEYTAQALSHWQGLPCLEAMCSLSIAGHGFGVMTGAVQSACSTSR